jgi:hypothetical protein
MKFLQAAIGIAAAMTVGTVLGHHASNLDYDADSVGTIAGVVEDVFWSNPHIHYYVTVTREDGATETWDMEGPNLASLGRRGVTRDMVQIGDEVEITGTLGREGRKRIWAQTIRKADGSLVMESAR